jgi:hypothetical protein
MRVSAASMPLVSLASATTSASGYGSGRFFVESIVIIIGLRHAFFDKTIWRGATRWLFLDMRRAAWQKKTF